MHIDQLLQCTLYIYLEGEKEVAITVGSNVCFHKNDYFGTIPKRIELILDSCIIHLCSKLRFWKP